MKSQLYLETVPAEYAGKDHFDSSYRHGWNRGHGIACHNMPKIGQRLFSESLGRMTVDAENIREVHESACFESEMNSRDYSPFEHFAHELNSLEEFDSEKAWEAYDQGIADAIHADLATYTDESYGIEKEEIEA